MPKLSTRWLTRASFLSTPLALLLALASCASLPKSAAPSENLVVFPADVKGAEALLTHPAPQKSLLARYGIAPQAELEKILGNAWDYSSEGKSLEAAQVMALFYRRMQAAALTVDRVQLTALLHPRAFWLEDAGEVETPQAILEFAVAMLKDEGPWRDQLPRGLTVTSEEEEATLAYYLAKSQANLALLLVAQDRSEEGWPPLLEAINLYDRLGAVQEASFYGSAYMTNAFQKERYEAVLRAAEPLLSLMASSPNDVDPEDLLRVGALSGLARAALGDLSGAIVSLRNHGNLVTSAGFPATGLGQVDEAVQHVKALLVERVRAGTATLEEAILADDDAAVAALLDHGADVNQEAVDGKSPLMLACAFSENARIAELLIAAGADVNAVGPVGTTALALAAGYTDRLVVVNLLLARGAQVNRASPQGWTPLMLAVRRGSSPAIVAALLAAGADPRAKTAAGVTALELVTKGVHANAPMEKLLRIALAKK